MGSEMCIRDRADAEHKRDRDSQDLRQEIGRARASLESASEGTSKQLAALQRRFDSVNERVRALETETKPWAARLIRLESFASTAQDQINSMRENMMPRAAIPQEPSSDDAETLSRLNRLERVVLPEMRSMADQSHRRLWSKLQDELDSVRGSLRETQRRANDAEAAASKQLQIVQAEASRLAKSDEATLKTLLTRVVP